MCACCRARLLQMLGIMKPADYPAAAAEGGGGG